MPNDKRPPWSRTLAALDDRDPGDEQRIPTIADRPPGVPRTPTARDLGAECRAAIAALLEGSCLEADITTTEAGGVVTVDLTAKLTVRGVEVLTERAKECGRG